jgi:hypothetical protein
MSRGTVRIAVAAVLATVLLLAVATLAGAAAGKGKPPKTGKTASAAQQQYGPSGKQYGKTKVTLCHKGHTITVGAPAARAHLRHGDHAGAC